MLNFSLYIKKHKINYHKYSAPIEIAMKHFRLLSVLFIAVLTITITSTYAFFADESQNEAINKIKEDALGQIDVLACLNNGGVIKSVCMLKIPACVQEYADAGKACTDGSDCSGECLTGQPFFDAGVTVTGACSVNNDICGCFQSVKLGVAQPALCVD
jgi:hypothetical protein